MKKIAFFIVGIMLGFTLLFSACGQTDSNVIRLNEVTHSVFYAPLYIAINKGYFADEGLTIELTNGGGADKSMAALVGGSADIGLMGPEAAVYIAAQGRTDQPTVFGQLTKKDGSFIVGRTNSTFSWTNMVNTSILGGREGGVPAMALEHALHLNGLDDGTNINIRFDIAFDAMAGSFAAGEGDYVTLFEPTASKLVAENKGYIMQSVGQAAGEMPFTCFMANKSYINSNTDKIYKFLKAVVRGYNYAMTASVDNIVDALMPSFTGVDRSLIESSFINYKSIDCWNNTPIMTEESYNRLIQLITNYGTLRSNVAFNKIVDNSYAQTVINEYI